MAKPRILVVEDDSIVVMELQDRLHRLGYVVADVASFGEEAVEKAVGTRPDLMLMDIRLKGATDGVQAAEEIRTRLDIPVVFLTAYADENTLRRAKATEPYGYIIKPFEERDLHTTIEMALHRHAVGQRLKENQRWLATTLRSIGDAVVTTDENGQVTFMNTVAEVLTGWTQAEALGRGLNEVCHIVDEATGALVDSPVDRALRQGTAVNLSPSSLLWTRHGTITPIGDSAAPITDDQGRVLGVVLVFRDNTDNTVERKQAHQALRESERRYRQLVENAHDAIYTHDQKGNLTSANPAMARMFGYAPEELLQMNIAQIVSAEHVPLVYRMIEQKLEGADQADSYELLAYSKAGEPLWIDIRTTRLVERDGQLVEVEGIARDISERKRAEEERQKLQAQLLQSQKMEAIGTLAGGVAHDFNNLLMAIMGYSELLLGKLDPDDPVHSDLEQIRKAGLRAASLTRQLLAFSRKQVLQEQVLDLNVLVSEMGKMMARLIGEDIELAISGDPALARVRADPSQLEQVILNLALNARDAMPNGGRLSIRAYNVSFTEAQATLAPEAHPGSFVCLAVTDTGVGMHRSVLERIFEPFFSTKENGTGLGLSVVHGIVHQHGGWITVDSAPGHGSCFGVYLPAFQIQAQTAADTYVPLQAFRGGGQGILLVEDEPGVRSLVAKVLRERGYLVFEAAKAEEALDIFERERGRIHLVFSDVVLPGQTGLQLVDRLLSRNGQLRVLLSSGYSEQKSRLSAIQERQLAFVQKPYSMITLLEAIKKALEPIPGPEAPPA